MRRPNKQVRQFSQPATSETSVAVNSNKIIPMKKTHHKKNGSTVICAVLTLLIVSLIGATVLFNCTTRYNASSKQVKGWNEALYAAEAGADVAFAEVRKIVSSASTFSGTFPSDGWT